MSDWDLMVSAIAPHLLFIGQTGMLFGGFLVALGLRMTLTD